MQTKSSTNIKGIDVSHHQGQIDWLKVKSDGVKYAFIKTTEGKSSVDSMFEVNAQMANTAGIKVGFYHYAHPELNSYLDEANNFISKVKKYKVDLMYVLDLEGAASQIGKAKVTQWAVNWLNEVKKQTGKSVGLYTGASFAKTYCGSELGEFPLWIAHYGVDKPMDNSTWDKWSVFQYTSTGKVNGISGNVDMNVMEESFFNSLTQNNSVQKDVCKVDELVQWQKEMGEKAIDALHAEGLIDNPDDWKKKLGEHVPNWLLFTMLSRIANKK